MNGIWRKLIDVLVPPAIGLYLGSIGGNVLNHYVNYREAVSELQKPYYGSELRSEWQAYKEREKAEMTGWEILIPVSYTHSYPYRPLSLTIEFKGDFPETSPYERPAPRNEPREETKPGKDISDLVT